MRRPLDRTCSAATQKWQRRPFPKISSPTASWVVDAARRPTGTDSHLQYCMLIDVPHISLVSWHSQHSAWPRMPQLARAPPSPVHDSCSFDMCQPHNRLQTAKMRAQKLHQRLKGFLGRPQLLWPSAPRSFGTRRLPAQNKLRTRNGFEVLILL